MVTKLSQIDPWLEPYDDTITQLQQYVVATRKRVIGDQSLEAFALGHHYFGLQSDGDEWVLREWAPNATRIYVVCDASQWDDIERFSFRKLQHGNWELRIQKSDLPHMSRYKLHVFWPGGDGYRIPAYANRVVQDHTTHDFNAQVWHLDKPFQWTDGNFTPSDQPPIIYEAHIGMASEEEHVSSYRYFSEKVLPRIARLGYNTVQLMAIQEHPYYGSFGYHVSSFFAPSSRFGTPEELKQLINTAHSMGLRVLLDVVHSHAVKNENEGLSKLDGTRTQYFKEEDHPAWDSRLFDYGKSEVVHFLLSNCRYWLEEFHFDGFRFDGVTSMLYTHHGLGYNFTNYDDYFNGSVNQDAYAYLSLANDLIHHVTPHAITIAEDTSAFPGLCSGSADGGVGFDYRLSMGTPDLWIKLLKEQPDEDWDLGHIFHELMAHRPEERTISYAESHDQALVGDKTIIFRLIDAAMYQHMRVEDDSLAVARGIALHKLIRLITYATNNGGYLNFMGNEFGHPEWIDFPREGNQWSYKYARRQWRLVDDASLKYHFLARFDAAMLSLKIKSVLSAANHLTIRQSDHVISFMRGDLLFVFNFSPETSYPDYAISAAEGRYTVLLSSDNKEFGGFGRVDTSKFYHTATSQDVPILRIYIPNRTAIVLKKEQ